MFPLYITGVRFNYWSSLLFVFKYTRIIYTQLVDTHPVAKLERYNRWFIERNENHNVQIEARLNSYLRMSKLRLWPDWSCLMFTVW